MSGTVQESFDRAWREGIQSKTQQKDQESDEDSGKEQEKQTERKRQKKRRRIGPLVVMTVGIVNINLM